MGDINTSFIRNETTANDFRQYGIKVYNRNWNNGMAEFQHATSSKWSVRYSKMMKVEITVEQTVENHEKTRAENILEQQ
jgi:hypothetical protein